MESQPEAPTNAPTNDAPTWLDNDFIQSLLRDNDNDENITVQNIDVRSAVGKGENYASQLHRVKVKLLKGELPEERVLIVKSLPNSDMMVQFILEAGIFEKETLTHLETLPSMYKLEENGLSNEKTLPPLSCKAYKTTRPYTIVMEDLQQLGFKMANRLEGLDLKHSKLAIRALARLHALSWGLLDKDPKCMEPYAEKMYIEAKREQNEVFMSSGAKLLSAEISTWQGYEHFAEKLKALSWVDIINEQVKVKDGGLAVLDHGDAWVNNMMFKYNKNGEVEDIRLLDFQMSRYSSPALDIQYFMYTSPNAEVRTKYWDELMEEYHKVFVTVLEGLRLNRRAPTLEEIKKEVETKMIFGLFTACVILPIILVDSKDAPDTSEMTMESFQDGSTGNEFSKTYGSVRYRNAFQKILLHFQSLGLL